MNYNLGAFKTLFFLRQNKIGKQRLDLLGGWVQRVIIQGLGCSRRTTRVQTSSLPNVEQSLESNLP